MRLYQVADDAASHPLKAWEHAVWDIGPLGVQTVWVGTYTMEEGILHPDVNLLFVKFNFR